MALRVVFADDNFLVREGVAALLAEVEDVELVRAVADPRSLLESVAEHHPDAVLTDIRMPPSFTSEGIDAPTPARWSSTPRRSSRRAAATSATSRRRSPTSH